MKQLKQDLFDQTGMVLQRINFEIFTAENPTTIFLASDDIKKYDAYIMKEL